MAYDLGKSVVKSVKYPIFAAIAGKLLLILEASILGFAIQFPEGVSALTDPGTAIALGVVIFVYDYLKHKTGVKLV